MQVKYGLEETKQNKTKKKTREQNRAKKRNFRTKKKKLLYLIHINTQKKENTNKFVSNLSSTVLSDQRIEKKK